MPEELTSDLIVLSGGRVGALHDAALLEWYDRAPGDVEPGPNLESVIRAQHFCNFSLWGREDEARRDDVDDAYIADIKRAIDQWNQKRSDLAEAVDREILARLDGADVSGAVLHSETAGMMIDRLSILALKIRNMGEYALRKDDPALARTCAENQERLKVQRADLLTCMEGLVAEFRGGTRYFKSYKQFKAYNDPRLNPAVRR